MFTTSPNHQSRYRPLTVDHLLPEGDQAKWMVVPRWLLGCASLFCVSAGACFGSLAAEIIESFASSTQLPLPLWLPLLMTAALAGWLISINSSVRVSSLPKPVRGQLKVIPKSVTSLATSLILAATVSTYQIAIAMPADTAITIIEGSFLFTFLFSCAVGPIVERRSNDFYSNYGFTLF